MFLRISLRGIILLDKLKMEVDVEVEVEVEVEVGCGVGLGADKLSTCSALSHSLFIASAEPTTVTLPLMDAE